MSETRKISWWKRVLFSELLVEKNTSHKIAYIGILVALNIVVNAYASWNTSNNAVSIVVFTSALTGLLIGPVFGFCTCFLSDTIGFFIAPKGDWIFLLSFSTGLFAVIFALCVNGIPWYKKGAWVAKIVLACIIAFFICTCGINTTVLWIKYAKTTYWAYSISRLFIQGQLLNSIVNYALLFAVIPLLNHIKPLKIRIR